MARSAGHSLEPSIQRATEDRMGDSFGDVRVHTGPQAAEACDRINARAFTVCNHVAFNRGEYDPVSVESQHVNCLRIGLRSPADSLRSSPEPWLAALAKTPADWGAVPMPPQKHVELDIVPVVYYRGSSYYWRQANDHSVARSGLKRSERAEHADASL